MLSGDHALLACAPHEANGPATIGMCEAKPPTVLVVDDDKDIRDLLADALAAEGYCVLSARHGAEALERLRVSRADVILLDLMMPVMDGLAFMEARSADPVLRDIPVIAMTAATRSHVEGAVTLMRKPFDLDLFLESVARCVAKLPA